MPTYDLNQQTKILEELLKRKDNMVCAECPSKIPRWASITFGVFICIRCSGKFIFWVIFHFNFVFIGVHRQLGTHITKVKSVNLDKWPDPKIDLI